MEEGGGVCRRQSPTRLFIARGRGGISVREGSGEGLVQAMGGLQQRDCLPGGGPVSWREEGGMARAQGASREEKRRR